jgi:hypothetical protein
MALYYWVGGTNTWNATVGTKWATTDGGTTYHTAIPGATDDVFFTALSGAFTVTLASPGATVGTINFTGFTGTFTFAANLSSGNTTLGASTTYTASGGNPTTYTFTPRNVNSTFTANSKILPTNLSINLNATTLTFAGNADFGGNITTSATAHNIKAATGTSIDLRIGGNISLNAITTSTVDPVTIKGYGTSKTYASGNATTNARISFVALSSYTSSASCGLAGTSSLTVETNGQFTVPNSAHTFTNTGTVTLSGFNSSNNNSYFFGLSASGIGTIVLSNDTVIKSSITITTLATTISSTAGAKLLLEGNFLATGGANYTIDILEFSGTTANNVTAVTNVANLQIKQLIINKTGAGSVDFNSAGYFTLYTPTGQSYSWTHTAGTITQSNNCIIRFSGVGTTSTFNYNATSPTFTFRNVDAYAVALSLNSTLNATTFRITTNANTSITSSATFGFNTEQLIVVNPTTSARTVTLKSGVTYNITSELFMYNPTVALVLNASTPGTKAKFNLSTTATQLVELVNPTDIDSSGNNNVGAPIYQTIYSLNGVLTTTFNWSNAAQPPPVAAKVTVAYTFVN